ncbi:MAG: DUF4388 domain-containing protein [Chloroflexota bacterium]|nr:DUF4388 domain-containing protein [Chloroflexota bacterium]
MAERNNYIPTNPNIQPTNSGGTNDLTGEAQNSRSYLRHNTSGDNSTSRLNSEGQAPHSNYSLRTSRTEPLSAALSKNGVEQEPTIQEVLHGSLRAFSPSSLLSLLNIQKATGHLRMRSNKFEGYIFVDRGEVYDAGLGSVNGALALFQLFGWKQGEFTFELGGANPARRTIEASLPVLQVRATLWLDNMNKYMPIIPSTSHRIAVANEPRSEVVIEPYQWPVLTKIVSRPMSISMLATELNQDLMTVTRIAADLVKMGVAVVYEPEPSNFDTATEDN